jgi:putative redox protein
VTVAVDTVKDTGNAKETTVFERKIHLVGKLDDVQKTRLLEIANHCPVHKHLSGTIQINTSQI